MPTSIYDLPLETLTLIVLHAQLNDKHATHPRVSISEKHQQHLKDIEHEQLQQREICPIASSTLQLNSTSRTFYHASLAVLYQDIDFRRVKAPHRQFLLTQLSESRYSRYLRSLKLKIALGIATSTSTHPNEQQQALVDHNDAISIPQAVELLDTLPYLTSLEVVLVNCLPGSYVSRLPGALDTSFQRLAPRLSHFGMSCEQYKVLPQAHNEDVNSDEEARITATPYFHLDEQLVADAVSVLPQLGSLTLSKVSYDTLADSSPLFEAVSSLHRLKQLDLLDVSSINDKWTSKAMTGPLESLHLVCNSRAIPSHCDTFINLHKNTLKHLSLSSTSSTLDNTTSTTSGPRPLYHLPVLDRLTIQADNSEIGTLAYLERYTTCSNLNTLAIKRASGMTVQELGLLISQKKFKALKRLDIGNDGVPGHMEDTLMKLWNIGQSVGVDVFRV